MHRHQFALCASVSLKLPTIDTRQYIVAHMLWKDATEPTNWSANAVAIAA